MKEFLSENNINYAYVDICSSIMSLKSFLKIRDTSEAYAKVRERHSAGIPMLMIDDDVNLISGVEKVKELVEKYNLKEE